MAAARLAFLNTTMNRNYLRIWWLALAVAMLMGFVRCGSAEENQNQKPVDQRDEERRVPQITWKDLSYVDTTKVGDTIVRDFVFYNTGWKPVVIKHAIPNRQECTCRIPDHEVPMGAQDTVRLTCVFTEPERVGMQILIEHNTPQPTPTLIYITTVQ
jgi:hypothetical protein